MKKIIKINKLISTVVIAAICTTAVASDKELVIYNWLGGSERKMMRELEEGFTRKYPEISVREINPSAGSDDERSNIRTALLSGERFDLLLNTWPSFEKELVEADLIKPIDNEWEKYSWSSALNNSWRNLSKYNNKTYGAYFLAGNRSGVWYRNDTMELAQLDEPKDWTDFLNSMKPLRDINKIPVFIGARSWAQTEWFENVLLKTMGTDYARKLANHEVSWLDDGVKQTFVNLRDMLKADCCSNASTMLSTHWTDAADAVLLNADAGYMLIGSWVNNRAADQYKLTPGKDYSFFPFPTINKEFENTMSVDGKNLLIMKEAKNPEAAALFIDFTISREGTKIISKHNKASPSLNSDISEYDPVVGKYAKELAVADVFFVLDDLLPAELSGEFRTGLQRFLRDPSDKTIETVTLAMEEKASELY